ncbi:MAG TPA: efflux RND transporter periplasmic adaptor subunit [Saprospiraceae bacterium]|nr:efflux RND transporter periplasmic adaptor subunit [Saprospiraceae bacterium]
MKYLHYTTTILLFLVACSPNGNMNNGLDSKKELLKEKKLKLRTLQTEIEVLEEEIMRLSPEVMKKPILVNTTPIVKSDFERFSEFYGTLISDDIVNVSSETGGRILHIGVREGNEVKRGQLIVKVDLESVEKQIDEVKKSLELAETLWEKQKRLWESEIGSEIQYLQARNNKERLEKSLALLELQMGKQNIYAPISGIVERLILKTGETCNPAQPILQIMNIDEVKVEADIAESYIGKLKLGDDLSIRIPALDTTFVRKIDQIGSYIDPANRTFRVTARTPNKRGKLKPNLLAIVQFRDYYLKDALSIPVDYIMEEVDGKKYIYTAEKTDSVRVAKKIYIQTGENYMGRMIIYNPLPEGTLMVTEGVRSLTDGQPLILSQEEEKAFQ